MKWVHYLLPRHFIRFFLNLILIVHKLYYDIQQIIHFLVLLAFYPKLNSLVFKIYLFTG